MSEKNNIFTEGLHFWTYLKFKNRLKIYLCHLIIVSYYRNQSIMVQIGLVTLTHLYIWVMAILFKKLDKEIEKDNKKTLLPFIKLK